MLQPDSIAFLPPSVTPAFSSSASVLCVSPKCPLRFWLIKRMPQQKSFALRMALTEDPVERRVRQELSADGVNFDELLNAGKVVTLTRKLDILTEQCSSLPSDSPEYKQTRKKMTTIETDLTREKRQVMKRWLKQLFLGQAVLFLAVGGALSNNAIPHYSVPLVGQALGFWMTWLFSIPALRARKGTEKWEKSALNFAFLTTPLLNLTLPLLTKNCATIWAADVALLFGSYVFYATSESRSARSVDRSDKPEKERARVKGILKYLDWGSWR